MLLSHSITIPTEWWRIDPKTSQLAVDGLAWSRVIWAYLPFPVFIVARQLDQPILFFLAINVRWYWDFFTQTDCYHKCLIVHEVRFVAPLLRNMNFVVFPMDFMIYGKVVWSFPLNDYKSIWYLRSTTGCSRFDVKIDDFKRTILCVKVFRNTL